MRKEISFLVIAAIIALGIIIVYYWGGQPTGFAIIGEYTNDTACVFANYSWYDGNCYEEQPVCDIDFLELCEDETNCTVAEGHWYDNICNSEEEPSCSNNLLSLCEDETNCTSAGGHWYDNICNSEEEPSCSNDFSLCLNETSCEDEADGYWYDSTGDGNLTCNEYECATDSQCDENSECLDGFCEVIEEELELEIPILEEQIPILIPVLGADNIENLKLNPGASSLITWNVVNNGQVFLTSCSFETSGDYSEWISFASEGLTDIGIGNTANFNFSVNVPEEIEEGEYALGVTVRCSQVYVSKQFVLQVETKKLEFDLIAADRTRLDRVRIIYSLGELTGEPQDVQLKFMLIGLEGGEEVAFIEENRSLKANATKEFKANMPINESLEGELELVINYNSEIYSSSVREPIVLGAPIGGFAIFEEIGAGEIAIIVIVLVSLVLVLFVVKKIRSSGKTLKTLFQRKKKE